MAEGDGDNQGGSNGYNAGILVRAFGAIVMGSAIGAASYLTVQVLTLTERLAVLETSVDKFHAAYYRQEVKHDKIEEEQWKAIRSILSIGKN